ncbi:MAG: FlgK family flagellar hook-associated protein, partial [Gammaproteobacteria bacterium]
RLSTEAGSGDPSRQRLMLTLGATRLPMDANSLGGGSIAGVMRFRDEDLPAMRERARALALGVATAYNEQQKLGVDGSGNPGKPMFALSASPAADCALSCVLPSGSALATGYAMSAELAASNKGDLSVASFAPDPEAPGSRQAVTLRFNASANAFEVTDKVTGAPTGVALSYTPGQPIRYDGHAITLQGTPGDGDRISVVPTADHAADNRNARAMLALADQKHVQVPGVAGGSSFGDAYAAMLADVGTRARSAQASESVSLRLLDDAKSAQAANSGVNLDEEAARLMQHQQMYQAAAKVIQAAQSMFDTLLQATSR